MNSQREQWINTYIRTSLPRAVAKACQEHGSCKWQACVMQLIDRLEKAGVDVNRIEIRDGWGEPEDYPYYWAGNGEFYIGYEARAEADLAAIKEKIVDELSTMLKEGALQVEDTGTEGSTTTWAYVKAIKT